MLEECGQLDEAIELLREAEPLAKDSPRLLLCARHNLLDNLTKAGRFSEALPLLPVVKTLSRSLGHELDLVRLQWVEGLIARSLGESQQAIELLTKVRGEFSSRSMPFDTALVTLELASLHLQGGAHEQVKTLARHLVMTFRALSVHRETLAAIILFQQAAERGRVTEELLGRLMRFLRDAEHEPGLRFA